MTASTSSPNRFRWRTSSIALIFAVWAVLQIGGLFTPGLLDDVDSVYIQIAREMLQRHDFVTPTIDGIRFFDKPPLMYWAAAGSMHVFGVHDWAARLPLALSVLVLLFSVYALGIRLLADISPANRPDRGGLYSALATGTALGPYLYTRFYIPDIVVALWMTLSVHLFLIAMDRIPDRIATRAVDASGAPLTRGPFAHRWGLSNSSSLLPMLGFAAVLALSVLTKGLIGLIFPVLFVLLYLAITRNLRALAKLHLVASTAFFLLIAAPWHILAALRNPPIPMPSGVGLPAHAGWAWFYLYNEHIARFLGRRIPHDYGQVPIPLFWLLLLLWLLPWVAFLPAAVLDAIRELHKSKKSTLRFDSDADADFSRELAFSPTVSGTPSPAVSLPKGLDSGTWRWSPPSILPNRRREAALSLLLWPAIILGFFTLSSRQEYYHLPALPALALLVGGLLAAADAQLSRSAAQASGHEGEARTPKLHINPVRQARLGSLCFLVPLGALLFLLCGYLALTAPAPHSGVTLNDVLRSNPADYDLSLGHIFDLTGRAMGFFRGPLLTVALCMLVLGPISHLVRRRATRPRSLAGKRNSSSAERESIPAKSNTPIVRPAFAFAANLLVVAAMTGVLLAAHEGLVRFYPILGSKGLALAIDQQLRSGDLVVIDGELTAGSTLLFYTPDIIPARDVAKTALRPSESALKPAQSSTKKAPEFNHVLLVNGRRNGPWFGSFWPDSPHIFLDNSGLRKLWAGPNRVFLLTYHPNARKADLGRFGPVFDYASSGGKTILTNRANSQ